MRGKKAKRSRKAKVAALPAKRKRKAAARPAMPKKAALAPPPAKAPKKPPVTISAVPAPLIAPSPPPARPAPVKKVKPAPAVKPTAAPSAALTPPPPKMAETVAKTKKTPAARPGGEPKAREKAELPPARTPLALGRAMQIVFKSTASKLPDTSKAGLKTLAAKLKGQPVLRLHIMAYAGGESLSFGKARRLSLARALSVRSYLIESGVRTTRIDARPHGKKTAEEPLNRVDVIVAER